ncbi:MAG TPA: hypothetical protein VD903_22515, partial [Pseudonocardia sp.]|nr:hypothetical protein [Pseudonocardia sp.]
MTDVDDEKLGALFRAAAGDAAAPPPGFDHEGVVRASRRATARRRAVVTGAGLALFAVVGIGGALVVTDRDDAGGAATVAAPMIAPTPEDSRFRPDAAPPADPRAQRQAPPPAEG